VGRDGAAFAPPLPSRPPALDNSCYNNYTASVVEEQQQQNESKPWGSREEEIYLTILRTAEVLSWGVIETLKRADLTPTQYNALRILRGAGPSGASCREVGERMVTKESDVTRLLNRLEARGLISRERGEDRRYLVVRITDKGLRLLSKLDEPVAECHRRQLGHMGDAQFTSLSRLLKAARMTQEQE
jgi:DNA-binding MarR family transcriptional regulator